MILNEDKTIIRFNLDDLKTLSRFKEIVELSEKAKALLAEARALNKVAFAEVELFCSKNNIHKPNLQFDKIKNYIEILPDTKDELDGLSQLFKDIMGLSDGN